MVTTTKSTMQRRGYPIRSVRDEVTLAVTSCRSPGWLFDRERADATFGELRLQSWNRAKLVPPALFLIGDQIYADATAGVFDPTDSRERFYEAYREAWTAPNARAVLSRLPVYMMMDDHEAGNDWHPHDLAEPGRPGHARGGVEGVPPVSMAALARKPGLARRSPAPGEKFWYDFEVQGVPIFMCDTRSGRSEDRKRMLDDDQSRP